MFTTENIENLLKENRIAEAVEAATKLLESGAKDDRIYFLRGKARWRAGDTAKAIADYRNAVAINPDSPAAQALEHADDIMNFYNPDLLNP